MWEPLKPELLTVVGTMWVLGIPGASSRVACALNYRAASPAHPLRLLRKLNFKVPYGLAIAMKHHRESHHLKLKAFSPRERL